MLLTMLSIGGSPPASISSTFHSGTSDSLLASRDPAVPPPTMMKSNLSPSGGKMDSHYTVMNHAN